jgi:hypothetical protein
LSFESGVNNRHEGSFVRGPSDMLLILLTLEEWFYSCKWFSIIIYYQFYREKIFGQEVIFFCQGICPDDGRIPTSNVNELFRSTCVGIARISHHIYTSTKKGLHLTLSCLARSQDWNKFRDQLVQSHYWASRRFVKPTSVCISSKQTKKLETLDVTTSASPAARKRNRQTKKTGAVAGGQPKRIAAADRPWQGRPRSR